MHHERIEWFLSSVRTEARLQWRFIHVSTSIIGGRGHKWRSDRTEIFSVRPITQCDFQIFFGSPLPIKLFTYTCWCTKSPHDRILIVYLLCYTYHYNYRDRGNHIITNPKTVETNYLEYLLFTGESLYSYFRLIQYVFILFTCYRWADWTVLPTCVILVHQFNWYSRTRKC